MSATTANTYTVLTHDAGIWGFTVRQRADEAPALYCCGEFFAAGDEPSTTKSAKQIAAELMSWAVAWAKRVKLQRWDGGRNA